MGGVRFPALWEGCRGDLPTDKHSFSQCCKQPTTHMVPCWVGHNSFCDIKSLTGSLSSSAPVHVVYRGLNRFWGTRLVHPGTPQPEWVRPNRGQPQIPSPTGAAQGIPVRTLTHAVSHEADRTAGCWETTPGRLPQQHLCTPLPRQRQEWWVTERKTDPGLEQVQHFFYSTERLFRFTDYTMTCGFGTVQPTSQYFKQYV